jgi:hypothetical protein
MLPSEEIDGSSLSFNYSLKRGASNKRRAPDYFDGEFRSEFELQSKLNGAIPAQTRQRVCMIYNHKSAFHR